MRAFAIEFEIRKGCGPSTFLKTIEVGLDDLDSEMSEGEIKEAAKWEAEQQLYKTEDYPVYGKNWSVVNIYET